MAFDFSGVSLSGGILLAFEFMVLDLLVFGLSGNRLSALTHSGV